MNLGQLKQDKWIRRAAYALGALLLLWAIAWLAVPPLLKGQLEKRAGEALGRTVTVGKIDFLPWTLELTLHQLRIAGPAGPAGGPDALSVERLYIDGELQSLLRLAPVVDAIQVDKPVVRVRHLGDGHYDFDDILKHIAAQRTPAEPGAKPAHFALYNLLLKEGSVDFQDDSVGKRHELRDLSLGLPFLSNLPSQRDVKVSPHLAFVLNGSKFDSQAQGTPFAQTRKTDAVLRLDGFDLAPYLGYFPDTLPVRLQSAVVNAQVQVAFEQAPANTVRLSGLVEARGVRVAEKSGAPLLAFDSLRVGLDDVRPLEKSVKLGEVALTAPTLNVRRNAAGQINLLQAAATNAAPRPAATAAAAAAKPASAASSSASAPVAASADASSWRAQVATLQIKGATASWADDSLRPAASLALTDLALDASGIAWPLVKAVPFSGTGALAGGTLAFKGEATDKTASVETQITALPLQAAAPYLAQFLTPTLAGTLGARVQLQWTAPDLVMTLQEGALDNLALLQGKTSLASLRKLDLADVNVDLARQTVAAGRISLLQPKLGVQRDAEGRWMFERWLKAGPAQPLTPATAVPPAAAGKSAAARRWAVTAGELNIDGGAVSYADRSFRRPVALEVSALKLQARNLSPESNKAGPVTLSARVATPRGEPGRLDFRGNVAAQPLALQGRLEAVSIPAHAFAAYLQQVLNIELLRADASFRGQVRYAQGAAGPTVKVSGDTTLEDFRANSVPGTAAAAEPVPTAAAAAAATGAAPAARLNISEELLSWKALSLRGLDVSMAPGIATSVNVRETSLADFYARVSINEAGRINLQDLVRRDNPPPPAAGAPPAPASAPVAAEGPPAVINFGPISLVNGKVLFSDRFVKPNYSADLSDLTGRLGAFSSVPVQGEPGMADLELRGRAEGTASLEITGKLNPVAKPLALDIKGKVRDLELAPLSPYSLKYAGHGIERGKLSMDIAYRIQPDGQLTASNNLVLNQLTFGEPVPGATTSLPVKLAVALLADRNGVIDIDLPIRGSLNDPQFSIGPIIFKIIINLIGKAITSPFSLLAGAFGGGGDDLSTVPFAAGTAVLAPPARDSLDKIAKALVDRPALKMTVAGTASLEAEREGYKRERLSQLVQAEKRRIAVLAGQGAGNVAAVGADEYPALLRAVYRRADMPKPRNLVGMQKELPVPEMEALLLASIPVSSDEMRELAVQRGLAVKDYLASRQIAPERLFLGAPRTLDVKSQTTPGQAAEKAWRPSAELSLAAR